MTDLVQQKADTLASAIAKAEGWPIIGSLPNRINNPGDMKLGNRGYGTEQGKTIYLKADWSADLDDHTDGASALRRECFAILSGGSLDYTPLDTFFSLSVKWTGGDAQESWCETVCKELGVTEQSTLRQYILATEGD